MGQTHVTVLKDLKEKTALTVSSTFLSIREFTYSTSQSVTDVPTVMSCQATINGVSGQSASVMCLNVSDLEFISFLPTQVAATWEAVYLQPNPAPRRPAYVTGFSVGLAHLYVEANLYRAASKSSPYMSSSKPVIFAQIQILLFQAAHMSVTIL